MVLDDVTCCADAIVIAGATGHADVFGMRDLHVIDVVVVPDRLVHGVCEAQRQHVLYGFLAKVVVDAEYARRVEHLGDHTVKFLGAGQIMTEWLFDDHTTPGAFRRLRQAAVGQLAGDLWKCAWRHRHVEDVVASGTAVAVKFGHGVGKTLERLRIVERALYEADAVSQLLPSRFLERRAAMCLDVFLDELLEMVLGPVAARKAGQAEARRQQAAVGQVVDCRKQFVT